MFPCPTGFEKIMLPRLNPKARLLPPLLSALALGMFYWGLFRLPFPGAAEADQDAEKSRELQDESAVMRRYGKWQRALKPSLKLHAAYPDNHIFIGQLAEIYDHLGRFQEEAAMWEQFLLHAPRPIEGCPQVGQTYEKLGLGKQAIAAFEKCLGFEPENADSIFYLARALERNGEIERAAALYEHGAAISPGYLDLQIGLARMRLRQGKPEEARAVTTKIVAASPKNTDALLVLALSCQRLGERAEARKYLERGVQLADGYSDFHLALANMAEQDADLDGAIRHYQKVAELDKSNTQVAQRLALLKRAR